MRAAGGCYRPGLHAKQHTLADAAAWPTSSRVTPGRSSEVWGAVWRIPLTDGAMGCTVALDRQEGLHLDPPHYRRIEVTVTTPDGAVLDCLAYQVATREAAHIAPSAAYLGTMVRGAAEVGLPEGYVAGMRTWAHS